VRIISLVPSWTETLIESGIYPVGRTRFCIHPKDKVASIPIVGGTKTADWNLIREMKPDLLILDREENPRDFSEKNIPFWASHVTDGESLSRALKELAEIFKNEKLKLLSQLANQINEFKNTEEKLQLAILDQLTPFEKNQEFAYMIWRHPWMSVAKETYIGFVLQKLGIKLHDWQMPNVKYPEVLLEPNLNYLFSSEPFPFAKKKNELLMLNLKGAIVDGEKISWFGIRSLNFLQKSLGLSDPL
jgi:ABC-type Fe3+-hydroxamate transport system substrate-binding protein